MPTVKSTHVTRIDLEACGARGVLVRKWYEGFDAYDAGPCDIEDYLDEASIPALLAGFEKEGFTVEMASRSKGRALRGKITRMDILLDGDVWRLKKFPHGWTARTRPIQEKTFSHDEAQVAIQWLKDNNWTIFEWPGGVRAFRGRPYPVRDRAAILSLRRKFDEQGVNKNWDLAYSF